MNNILNVDISSINKIIQKTMMQTHSPNSNKKRNMYYSIIPTTINIKPIHEGDQQRTYNYKLRVLKNNMTTSHVRKTILDQINKAKFQRTGLHTFDDGLRLNLYYSSSDEDLEHSQYVITISTQIPLESGSLKKRPVRREPVTFPIPIQEISQQLNANQTQMAFPDIKIQNQFFELEYTLYAGFSRFDLENMIVEQNQEKKVRETFESGLLEEQPTEQLKEPQFKSEVQQNRKNQIKQETQKQQKIENIQTIKNSQNQILENPQNSEIQQETNIEEKHENIENKDNMIEVTLTTPIISKTYSSQQEVQNLCSKLQQTPQQNTKGNLENLPPHKQQIQEKKIKNDEGEQNIENLSQIKEREENNNTNENIPLSRQFKEEGNMDDNDNEKEGNIENDVTGIEASQMEDTYLQKDQMVKMNHQEVKMQQKIERKIQKTPSPAKKKEQNASSQKQQQKRTKNNQNGPSRLQRQRIFSRTESLYENPKKNEGKDKKKQQQKDSYGEDLCLVFIGFVIILLGVMASIGLIQFPTLE